MFNSSLYVPQEGSAKKKNKKQEHVLLLYFKIKKEIETVSEFRFVPKHNYIARDFIPPNRKCKTRSLSFCGQIAFI